MRMISRARAHMPHGKPEIHKNRPWLDNADNNAGDGTANATNNADATSDKHSDSSASSRPRSRRLDMELVERGFVTTRTKAQRLIESGAVSVSGDVETKPSRKVSAEASISVTPPEHQYVSRGAYKLLGAFEQFFPQGLPSPQGEECLDIGASTGGFTQVLLDHGARSVTALDVGHGQLDSLIATDSRVREMSGTNIRDVTVESLGFAPSYIVSDVSFISLTYVIPVIARIARADADCILLVKPQFEVGKGNLGKDGIVTDATLRAASLEKVKHCAVSQGLEVRASAPSPIEGTHGNEEYLLWLHVPHSAAPPVSAGFMR